AWLGTPPTATAWRAAADRPRGAARRDRSVAGLLHWAAEPGHRGHRARRLRQTVRNSPAIRRGLDSVRTGSEAASSPGSLRRRRIRRPGLLEMRRRTPRRETAPSSIAVAA